MHRLKKYLFITITAIAILAISNTYSLADQYYPASGGGSGSGTVTSLSAGTGITLSPNPITTTGTVTNNGVLSGDGTVENTSPTANALTLVNAPAYTGLVNATGSSAAPAYNFLPIGINSVNASTGATVNLTTSSATMQYYSAFTGNLTFNLPAASTCLGKDFMFFRPLGSAASKTFTVTPNGADTVNGASGSFTLPNNNGAIVSWIRSDGVSNWISIIDPIRNVAAGGTGFSSNGLGQGNLIYTSGNGSMAATGSAGSAGQLWQSNGTSAPTPTSTPGSGTALTSVTSASYIHTGNEIMHRVTVADAAYAQLSSDYLIAYTSLSTTRAVTLTTSGITAGQTVIIKDESGSAGTDNITTTGVNVDGSATATINTNYGVLRLYFNGTTYNTW